MMFITSKEASAPWCNKRHITYVHNGAHENNGSYSGQREGHHWEVVQCIEAVVRGSQYSLILQSFYQLNQWY